MDEAEEFTAMFREHYPRVLAFVSRRTDPFRAHDVVADTFATAWRHARDIRSTAMSPARRPPPATPARPAPLN